MKKKAFTLVELLVVIAIIGILIALLLPAVQAAREAARRMECTNKMKQIALAAQNYHDAFHLFPGGFTYFSTTNCTADRYNERAPWTVPLLPFLEQTAIYDQYQFCGSGTDSSKVGIDNKVPKSTGLLSNREIAEINMTCYNCPSDPVAGNLFDFPAAGSTFFAGKRRASSYRAVGGFSRGHCSGGSGYGAWDCGELYGINHQDWRGVYHAVGIQDKIEYGQESMASVIDGTSNTLAFVERHRNPGDIYNASFACITHWLGNGALTIHTAIPHQLVFMGTAIQADFEALYTGAGLGSHVGGTFQRVAGALHKGGMNAARVDGSVSFISNTMNLTTYRYLCCIGDGEVAGL